LFIRQSPHPVVLAALTEMRERLHPQWLKLVANLPYVRREWQMAGIEAVRDEHGGKCPWGGRKAGMQNKATRQKIGFIRQLPEQRRVEVRSP
jgi:hypothetical protein